MGWCSHPLTTPRERSVRRPPADDILHVLRDLMLGGRHSRRTVSARSHVSLPTADRWLKALRILPGVHAFRVGKTTWLEWRNK